MPLMRPHPARYFNLSVSTLHYAAELVITGKPTSTPLDQQLVVFPRRQPDGDSSPQAIATEFNLSAEAMRTV